MIYLLTAIGLSPGGSTHLHTNNTQNNKKQQYIQQNNFITKYFVTLNIEGRDSSVGIATRYGLDGPENRIPVGARFSAPVQTGPGPTQPPIQWVQGLSRV